MNERDPLRDALDGLPREIQPGADLWPGISARLDRPQFADSGGLTAWQRRLGVRYAPMAGLLVAATLAVIVFVGPDRRAPIAPQPASPLTSLQEDYALIRADVLDVLDYRCSAWPQAACDGLRTGLRELDQTATELELAMLNAPADSDEARRLSVRYQRTLEQARGLAGHAARL